MFARHRDLPIPACCRPAWARARATAPSRSAVPAGATARFSWLNGWLPGSARAAGLPDLPTATSRATRPAPPTADEPPHERRVDPGRRLVPYHGGNGRIARAPPARARPAAVAGTETGMIGLVLVNHGRLAAEFAQAPQPGRGPGP